MHERDILLAALEKTRPEERTAFLAQACGTDVDLRRRVETLLRASEVQDSFLKHPAVETELLSRETEGLRRQTAEQDALSLDFLRPTDDPQLLGLLGSYEVFEVIGRGGMGVVLRARDPKLNRIVAIKVLAPELASNPTARKRFQREAYAAAAVVHQHIVTIHAVDEDRLPYLVMECIVGQSLKEKIDREGHLKLLEILRIGQQVASGLAAAHSHGLIHRDVKPANILLENGVERVRITDFGLARAVDDVGMTRTGEVAGTPQYMSPEQAQGLSMDCRSDLFSFGSVLYAMCTGRPPFRAENAFATARRVCEDTPRPIREVNPEIPHWLVAAIERLLSKKPEERFQSAAEVADLLGQHLAELQHPSLPGTSATTVLPSSIRKPKAKFYRTWTIATAAAIVLFLLAVSLTEATGVTQFAPTVIRIVRGEGTLVIEVDDPTVQVSLDGEALSIRGAGLQELRLLPGQYRLHATKDGQPVKDEVVTISRDGRKVVTVTRESSSGPSSPTKAAALQQPVGELTLLAKLEGHADAVRGVEFLPDGGRFVSVGRDKMIRTWDLATRSVLSRLPVTSYLGAADVSADGRFVALAAKNEGTIGLIHVWDLENRKRICEVPPQDFAWLNCVRFSPDGARVVTSGKPPLGVLWDISTGKEVQRFDAGDDSLTLSVEFSPDGRLVALGVTGGVRLFDTESGDVVGRVPLPQPRAVISLAFDPSGKVLACGQMGGSICLVDVERRQSANSLPNPDQDAHVLCLQFLHNDRLLMTTRGDSKSNATVEVWDVARAKLVAKATTEQGANKQLAVSPDGRYAITAGGELYDHASNSRRTTGDYALRLWQLPESVWPASSSNPDSTAPPLAMAPFDAQQARVHQEAWAQHLGVDVELTNSIGMTLRLIPPGRFLMGSPEKELDRGADEAQHETKITKPFFLGTNLVTVGQFKSFVSKSGYTTEAEKNEGALIQLPGNMWRMDPNANWQNPGFEQTDDHPVVCLSWNDATAFCEWLSAEEGTRYTLSTEAQWEFACRAGSPSAFNFGDSYELLSEYAWFSKNSAGKTHTVGQMKPNAWGLYDMHGNVYQWTADWYAPDYFANGSMEGPSSPVRGNTRVLRGGAWCTNEKRTRTAFRNGGYTPSSRANSFGLRVALVGDPKVALLRGAAGSPSGGSSEAEGGPGE